MLEEHANSYRFGIEVPLHLEQGGCTVLIRELLSLQFLFLVED